MSIKDIPLNLHLSNESVGKKNSMVGGELNGGMETANRRRSNSRSQGSQMTMPTSGRTREIAPKRQQFIYFVTLTSLNDTFVKKQLSVPFFPETRKLGRPAGAKIKPDVTNGYFDSRVLSRNHAAMFVDPASGKLMLKDLGSSNGTYVNEERIGSEAVEIKIGDTIYLGFNIQVDTNHKQISARVDNINVVSSFLKSSASGEQSAVEGTAEHKHVSFIQDLFSQLPNISNTNESQAQNSKSGNDISFDNALFGDINPSLEDSILGLYSKSRAGLFNNSQITNSSFLETLINTMSNDLVKVKQQNQTLLSIEQHLIKYKNRLNEINKKYLEQELRDAAIKYEDELVKERNQIQKLRNESKKYKEECLSKFEGLHDRLEKVQREKQALQNKLDSLMKSHSDTKFNELDNSSKQLDESASLSPQVSGGSLSPTESNHFNGNITTSSSSKNTTKPKEHSVQDNSNGSSNGNGNNNGNKSRDSSNTSDTEQSEDEQDQVISSIRPEDQREKSITQNTTSQLLRESGSSGVSSDSNHNDHSRHTNEWFSHSTSDISESYKTNELTPPVSDEEDRGESETPADQNESSIKVDSQEALPSETSKDKGKAKKYKIPQAKSQQIAVGISIVLLGVILQRYVTYTV